MAEKHRAVVRQSPGRARGTVDGPVGVELGVRGKPIGARKNPAEPFVRTTRPGLYELVVGDRSGDRSGCSPFC
jgi:hypothetical protein